MAPGNRLNATDCQLVRHSARTISYFVLLVGGSALVAGCSGVREDRFCSTDSDCANGACIDGLCLSNAEQGQETDAAADAKIEADADAPTDADAAAREETDDRCHSDADCAAGQRCAAAVCVQRFCVDDSDCHGSVCNGGLCNPPSGDADADTDTDTDTDTDVNEGPNLGEQRTAVILARYADMLPSVHDPQFFREAIFDAPNSISAFLHEVSLGRAWLSGDVFGWYQIERDVECVPYRSNKVLAHQVIEFVDGFIDFSQYRRVIIITPQMTGPDYCFGSADGSFGLETLQTDDGIVELTWMHAIFEGYINLDHPIASFSMAKKLIHNMGVLDTKCYDCGGVSIDTAYENCELGSEGSPFSIIGGGGPADHPNGVTKELIGWLREDEILRPSSTGEYVIYPIESNAPGPKTIRFDLEHRIILPWATDLTIEMKTLHFDFRRPIGLDGELENSPGFRDGLLVYGLLDVGINTNVLIDATPNSSEQDFRDAFLGLGETFEEPSNGIDVTPVMVQPDGGLVVQVDLDPR